jgi:membrane protein
MKLNSFDIPENSVAHKLLGLPRLFWLYLRLVARRFMEDGCQHSAAALTYMTLFAVVPVMTLMYSMFSLVPAFQGLGDQVRDLIFNNFVPSAGVEVQSYLDQFSSQARSLSFVGVGILVITSYLMLINIEKVFNRIWATPGRRKGVVSFLLYWGILSLGPMLIGATIAINTYLLTVRVFAEDGFAQEAFNIFLGYLPFILTTTAFTLLYMTVPNCKVRFANALTGGLVATLAFELAKRLFGYFIATSAYSSIYGAFAALPIFLLWVYLSWIIILAGAEFVRATENFSSDVRGHKMNRVTACVWVLWKFWQAQSHGIELRDTVLRKGGMSSNQWREVRELLIQHGIITTTDKGNYAMLRSLESMKLHELNAWVLDGYVPSADDSVSKGDEPPSWYLTFSERMHQARDAEVSALDISVAELFNSGIKTNG